MHSVLRRWQCCKLLDRDCDNRAAFLWLLQAMHAMSRSCQVDMRIFASHACHVEILSRQDAYHEALRMLCPSCQEWAATTGSKESGSHCSSCSGRLSGGMLWDRQLTFSGTARSLQFTACSRQVMNSGRPGGSCRTPIGQSSLHCPRLAASSSPSMHGMQK